MSVKKLWNDNWEFMECPEVEIYDTPPKTGEFQQVDLPHDWMIYDTTNLYRDSIGWYRKRFHVTEEERDGKLALRFDGVYMNSTVFVNDVQAGEWKYGYSAFEFDITDFLRQGDNWVTVRVVFQHCNSRWYSGAGIYRNVWLKKYPKEHIAADGVYVSMKSLGNGDFRVELDTEVNLDLCADVGGRSIRQSIYAPDGSLTAQGIIAYSADTCIHKIAPGTDNEESWVYSQSLEVQQPRLWNIGRGILYTLRTELLWNDIVIDKEEERIGFKEMSFDANKGFSLNGVHVKLNGVCEHHDFGCLGTAFYKDALRRKFGILRQMGVNAIRTSHNMPASELMDLADEMGFLILSESFDMWEMGKTTFDYGRFFKDWFARDVRSWVRRDRNHVSLLMWSIGNEIYDTQASEHGQKITKCLVEAVRKYDPKKNAPTTIGSNYMKWENGQKCSALVDCIGYNYGEYLYEEHHVQHPEWIIYGSETSSMLSSRNIYHFPAERSILTDEDEQCSSLGNSVTGWGAMSYEDTIFDDRDANFSLGQFLWSGFDYIGESTPYHTKNSYFGQIDTAGFPKDSYYIFQAEWTDYRVSPMIHIYPYWDFNKGQLIDVHVCTNAPECELFLNGESLGRRKIDHVKARKTVQLWKIPYEPGTLKAVAYDEDGQEVAVDKTESFGETKLLKVCADRTCISANGTDLLFLEIQAVDSEGRPVANARDRVHVTVTGAGRLVGLDNGDSTDFDQHKGRSRRLFGGKMLAVIAAKKEPGKIDVMLESRGTGIITYSYTAIACDKVIEGISAITENQDRELLGGGSVIHALPDGKNEIPVRKIELFTEDGREQLNKDRSSVVIRAHIYPENATYRDLSWRVLNEAGIEIDYAVLEVAEDGVRLIAKGDGEIRVRCITRNGGSAASVMSELTLYADGIGQAYINPYKEVAAGLGDVRHNYALEGIEHGISFMGEGTVGYSYIDFGPNGTEEITVSIFANTDNAVCFKVWENDPELGGELVLEAVYHVKHEWMVFKKMTYRLSKRLTGKRKIFFTTGDSFNFKEFVFTEVEKAFSILYASECSSIYGDEFMRNGRCVEGIGNNVLIEYESMDFGEKGVENITVCGSSPLEKSSIQIRFSHDGKTDVQMIQFAGCKDYCEQTFALERIQGKCKVTLVFLPGSNFNLKAIHFH